jgi:hypothetical protein
VEGPAPHSPGVIAQQPRDALPHLACGLVGERDRQNPGRINSVMLDEARDSRRKNSGFSGSGSGKHQHRPFVVQHRLTLCGIQSGERLGALDRQCVCGLRHRRKLPD